MKTPEQLRELAMEAVRRHSAIDKAKKWMFRKIDSMPELKEALLAPAIDCVIREAIYQVRNQQRRQCKGKKPYQHKKAKEATAKTEKRSAGRTRRSTKVMRRSQYLFLMHYTVGDKCLGECNKMDLQQARKEASAKKVGYAQTERFLGTLETRLGAHEIVRDKWKEAEVVAVWNQVTKTKPVC